MDRATPYHRPHSTQLAGYAMIPGGDDRYIGNLFVGGDAGAAYGHSPHGVGPAVAGTAGYDEYPASFEEYLARVNEQPGGDHRSFYDVKQPVHARGNVYAAGARPFAGERDARVVDAATASVVEEGDAVYLVTELPEAFDQARLGAVTGRDLGRVRFPDAEFEEGDGRPAVMDVDLVGGRKRPDGRFAAGPVADLASGSGRVRIW